MTILNKILHPFLFGIYPVVALLAHNIEEIQVKAALRSIIISILATVTIVVLYKLLLRDRHKVAIVSTLSIGLFFSYGHIYNFLEQVNILGITIGRHRLFVPVWIALFAIGYWWVAIKAFDLKAINKALNVIALSVFVFPLFQIGQFGIQTFFVSRAYPLDNSEITNLHPPEDQPIPDIYYIILDGYSRDDMLNKYYNLDNTPFLNRLTQMGFYVARCSQSNYAQSQLSLASSLNVNYINALDDRFRPGNTSRIGLSDLIKHSATRKALEYLGYTTIAFETGYEATQLSDAALYLSPRMIPAINEFETLFIRTTAARLLAEGVAFLNLPPDWEARDQINRERILYTLDNLLTLPDVGGPKFVFAHIIAPHWPHVFGPNGEHVHERPDSVAGYRNQVVFINTKIESIVSEILANSHSPPIIIIQADHGSIIESPPRRMSILNAYHLPYGGNQQLYENISPVNSFRVIFDYYFNGSFGLLEDVSYYSIYERPYEFEIVPNPRPGCSGQ